MTCRGQDRDRPEERGKEQNQGRFATEGEFGRMQRRFPAMQGKKGLQLAGTHVRGSGMKELAY